MSLLLKMASIAVALMALGSGLAAARYWYKASTVVPMPTYLWDHKKGELLFPDLTTGEEIAEAGLPGTMYAVHEGGRLNKKA